MSKTTEIEWDNLVATYVTTYDDIEALEGDYEDAECDFLVQVNTSALENLMACTPPNLKAFGEKLKIAFETDLLDASNQERFGNLYETLLSDLAQLQ